MKRVKIDDEAFTSLANIEAAIVKTAENKNYKRKYIDKVVNHKRRFARELQQMFKEESFEPKKRDPFIREDGIAGKLRVIDSAPFWPDQIVHTLIITLAQPKMIKGMIPTSCACVPGRGPHYGKRILEKWVRKPKKQYFAKLDICKYYPNVKPELAESAVKHKFKDSKHRRTLIKIINAYDHLPIGLLTSQWLANLILESADHYAKEQINIKRYMRYMDDIVILGPNKRRLKKQVRELADYLNQRDLTIKPNWCTHRLSYKDKTGKYRGKDIDFMGFRFFCDRTTIRKKLFRRLRRKALRLKTRKITPRAARSVLSYYGWLKHTDTRKFYNENIQKHMKTLKHIVRETDRKRGKNESTK